MRRVLVLFVLVAANAACKNPRTTVPAEAAATQPGPPAVLPPSHELRRAKLELSDRVAALSSSSDVPPNDAVLGAMHAMADMVHALPGAPAELDRAATSMRNAAEELESLPLSAPLTGDVTRAALQRLVVALDGEAAGSSERDAVKRELSVARRATEAIAPRTPVQEQTPNLHRAFCAVGDAVLTLSANGDGVRTCGAGQVAEASGEGVLPVLDDLRSTLRDIAVEEMDPSRLAAARAFEQLAVAFHRAGSANADLAWSISSLRSQAEAVRLDVERLEPGAAEVVAGLRAALFGLDSLVAQRPAGSRMVGWLTEARAAVDAVDVNGTYINQRATIQDAFRTLVDAFAVMTQLVDRCD